MKCFWGVLVVWSLLLTLMSASPCLASEHRTMEERVSPNLSEFGIVTGDAMMDVSEVNCSIDFRIRNRRVFETRRSAWDYCEDIHRFSGLRNVCFIRNFGDYFYESDFRFRGQGRSDNFRNVFDAIYRFLNQSRFFRSNFDIRFENVRNSGNCY